MFCRMVVVVLLLGSVSFRGRTDYSDFLSARSINKFYFSSLSNGLPGFDVESTYNNNFMQYTAVFPKDTLPPVGSDIRLVPSFEIDGYALFLEGERQTSGSSGLDFADGRSYTYTIFSYDGKSTNYTVKTQNAAAWFTGFGFNSTDNVILDESCYNIGNILVEETDIEGNAIWFDLPHSVSLDGLVESYQTDPVGARVCYVDNGGNEHWGRTPRDYSDYCVFRVYDNRNESYLDYRVAAYRLNRLSFVEHSGIEDIYLITIPPMA